MLKSIVFYKLMGISKIFYLHSEVHLCGHLAIYSSMLLQDQSLSLVNRRICRQHIFLNIISFRGDPPSITAILTSLQASTTSVVATTPIEPYSWRELRNLREENNSTYLELALKIRDIPFKRGKAASVDSILIPFKDSAACSISSKCRITGWSGPSMIPLAIIGAMA